MSGNAIFSRYARQLPILRAEGQEALAESRVAIVGLGGLGSVAAIYLAAAGVGELVVIDGDDVESHNLNRQIIFNTDDIGSPKAEIAASRLERLNPEVRVIPYQEELTPNNVERLLSDVDVVVDGLDNWEARLVIDAYTWSTGKTYVHGAAESHYGQVTTIKRGVTTCLACLAPRTLRRACMAILGPTAGLVGLLEALEAIKAITGIAEPLYNKIAVIDTNHLSFDIIDVKPVDCGVCGKIPNDIQEQDDHKAS